MRRLALIGVLLTCLVAAAQVLARPSDASRHAAPSYRYVFSSDSGPAAVLANGWNLIDVSSQSEADALPPGARGLVWIGDYDNSSCGWQLSDAAMTAELTPMVNDPKVAGYFFSDEPNPFACPNAPAEHKARSSLIHRLAPGKFTVMVMDSNSGGDSLRQAPLWKGAADFVGLNPYPCYKDKPCDYAWIDKIIKAGNHAGFAYWGAVQAFADTEWRWPTPAEEQHMLNQWAASRQSGYMVFAWTWGGNALASQTGLLNVFRRFNKVRPAKRTTASARLGVVPGRAQEVHYTFTGPTSVAFDWTGPPTTIRYGMTKRYQAKAVAHAPTISPFSSKGPFREVELVGLKPGATYHYSIGGGVDHTFSTAPTRAFRFDVEADIGDSANSDGVQPTQSQIAADRPAFVLVPGDLSYGNVDGQSAVDRHFNDVMVWSQVAAYMPAWGNHEWDDTTDDLRNYKGRFVIPHGASSPGAPSAGCCGEDWGWFDAGGVRFISYPEPYDDSTWADWGSTVDKLMAAAQTDPKINFIVTFGHRPAYSSGYHPGESNLAGVLGSLGTKYTKYVLNLNGHSHDYERFKPINGVVHITAGGGGFELEPWSGAPDSRTVYRAMHLEHLRIDVTPTRLNVQAICGPSSSKDGMSCSPGQVIDSTTILARR